MSISGLGFSASATQALMASRARLDEAGGAVLQASGALADGQIGAGSTALAGALVQQQAAVYAFKASIKMLEVQGSLVGTLLDATG